MGGGETGHSEKGLCICILEKYIYSTELLNQTWSFGLVLSSYIFTYIFIWNSVRLQHEQAHLLHVLTDGLPANPQNAEKQNKTVQFYKNVCVFFYISYKKKILHLLILHTEDRTKRSLHIYFLNSVTFCWCVLIITITTIIIIIIVIILYGVTNKTALM